MASDIVTLNMEDVVFSNDKKGRVRFFKVSEIILIEIIEDKPNNVMLFFKNDYVIIKKSLNMIKKKLDENVFFRANRHQIININMIEKVEDELNGFFNVYIKGRKKISFSRRQFVHFKTL